MKVCVSKTSDYGAQKHEFEIEITTLEDLIEFFNQHRNESYYFIIDADFETIEIYDNYRE